MVALESFDRYLHFFSPICKRVTSDAECRMVTKKGFVLLLREESPSKKMGKKNGFAKQNGSGEGLGT